ncbi:MAG: hypothetical protein HY787_17460 [Deltaproteobacteria bacterium]|nr:hypothetical protein [Deltaproteobacteria bacterium]
MDSEPILVLNPAGIETDHLSLGQVKGEMIYFMTRFGPTLMANWHSRTGGISARSF